MLYSEEDVIKFLIKEFKAGYAKIAGSHPVDRIAEIDGRRALVFDANAPDGKSGDRLHSVLRGILGDEIILSDDKCQGINIDFFFHAKVTPEILLHLMFKISRISEDPLKYSEANAREQLNFYFGLPADYSKCDIEAYLVDQLMGSYMKIAGRGSSCRRASIDGKYVVILGANVLNSNSDDEARDQIYDALKNRFGDKIILSGDECRGVNFDFFCGDEVRPDILLERLFSLLAAIEPLGGFRVNDIHASLCSLFTEQQVEDWGITSYAHGKNENLLAGLSSNSDDPAVVSKFNQVSGLLRERFGDLCAKPGGKSRDKPKEATMIRLADIPQEDRLDELQKKLSFLVEPKVSLLVNAAYFSAPSRLRELQVFCLGHGPE